MSNDDYLLMRAAYACMLAIPVDVALRRRNEFQRTLNRLRDAIAKHSGLSPFTVQTEFEREAAQ